MTLSANAVDPITIQCVLYAVKPEWSIKFDLQWRNRFLPRSGEYILIGEFQKDTINVDNFLLAYDGAVVIYLSLGKDVPADFDTWWSDLTADQHIHNLRRAGSRSR